MMDKNREAFEAWCSEKIPKYFVDYMITAKPPQYADPITERFWQIWQASREAIEVDPPSRRHSQGETTVGNDYMAMGFNLALVQYAEAITSLGIRVKGNEE